MKISILNNQGQSVIEAAIVLSVIIMVLFALISVGIYIYDMTVFNYAANKALDKGVGLLGGDNPVYHDGIYDNELTAEDKDSIKQTALNALNVRMFTGEITEDNIEVLTKENTDEGTLVLTVKINGSYDFQIPLVGIVFPNLAFEGSYTHKTRMGR